jgi:hypothetical protein
VNDLSQQKENPMNRRVVLGILVVLLLVVGAVAVGGFGYQMGVARGLADSGKLVAPQGGGAVAPFAYGAPYYYPGPWGWGFGFGFLQCLIPLLGILLIFGLLRGLFWRGGWGGRRGWGGHGYGPGGQGFGPSGQGLPPMFEEWHKRAHGEQKPEGQ